jgi:replicative DNA helicase|uniref:replicative DNA helicase n=1 Tax=Faecousia sp. TaxID=2952921 RepID=UPI0040273D82
MLDLATAEYSLVGCVLIDARCLPAAREILPTAEAFASEPCRKAYAAACRLEDEDKGIDPVIVGRAAGLSNDFLMQCMDLAPTCTRAAEYAKAVLDGHQRRQLQALGEKLQTEALCAGSTADQLLTEARSTLDDLASTPGRCSVKSARDSLLDFMTFRAEVQQGKRQAIRTGFPSLDRILGGFAQGGFYVMAARPGVGKSALGIALADMMARDRRVLYVSLEMTEAELNARRVAAVSDITCTFGKLLFGKTTEEQDAAIANACGKLYAHKLQISAVSTLTVPELELQARNVGAEVVIVDYLGLLSAEDKRLSEYDRVTQISGDLKRLAKRLGCVVLALCQLNRESVSAPGQDTRPRLSQLRSSGAIEQDSDGVLLLHRPEYGRTETPREASAPQQFFVDVAKNRHGRTGTAELAWYAPVNRFEDYGGKWTVKSWM